MKYWFILIFSVFSFQVFSQEKSTTIEKETIQIPVSVGFIKENNQYAFDVKTTKTVAEISVSVFSRWGNLIVKSDKLFVLWPKDAENQGTYFVKITGKWVDGTSFEKTGYINFY